MLLLHAGIADARMWDAQWERLASERRVIRYDARGFGRSPDPEGAWSRRDDAMAVLDAAGVDSAHLVGASMGGYTALELAAEAPERVRSVVVAAGAAGVVDPPEDLEAAWERVDALVEADRFDEANEEEMRLWADGRREPPPAEAAQVRAAVADVNAALLRRQRDMPDEQELEPPLPERLGDIGCPLLVVTGDADVTNAIDWCHALAAGVPQARLETWPGAAHMLTLERPGEFAELVLGFTA